MKSVVPITILLLAMIIVVHGMIVTNQLGKTLVWQYKTKDRIMSLVFTEDGYLGAASKDGCAYVFNPNGTLISKVCGDGDMLYASYSDGTFAFINADGYVYFVNKQGELTEKINVGSSYATISITPYGFIVCGYSCTYFDHNGNIVWNTDIGYTYNDPAYYNGYWFVADSWGKLVVIDNSTGIIVAERVYNSDYPIDVARCNNYLALTTSGDLYLYKVNVTDTDEIYLDLLWRKDVGTPTQVSFSADCRYVAVANTWNEEYLIYDIEGNLLLDYRYYEDIDASDYNDYMVTSIAWYGNTTLAVGLNDGEIHVYKIYSIKGLTVGSTENDTTPVIPYRISTVAAIAPIATALLRKRLKNRRSSFD